MNFRTVTFLSAAAFMLSLAALPATFGADAKKNLLKATNQPATWRFEQHELGKGTMAVDGDAIMFDVTEVGAEEWHVQVVQTGIDLTDGKEYVLTFKAKATPDRSMALNAMVDEDDWHTIGLTDLAEVGADWKDFKYDFKAESTSKGKSRISFHLGNVKGKLWLKDVTLTEK